MLPKNKTSFVPQQRKKKERRRRWGALIYLFCDLKLRAKFQNPRTTPSGRKGVEMKERKIIDTKYSGHFIPQQRPRKTPQAKIRTEKST